MNYSVRPKGDRFIVVDAEGNTYGTSYKNEDSAHTKIQRLRWEAPKATTAERPCITCKTPFQSEGAHNRMCGPCRNTASADTFGPRSFGHKTPSHRGGV